jgi:hypothetical protein
MCREVNLAFALEALEIFIAMSDITMIEPARLLRLPNNELVNLCKNIFALVGLVKALNRQIPATLRGLDK